MNGMSMLMTWHKRQPIICDKKEKEKCLKRKRKITIFYLFIGYIYNYKRKNLIFP